MYSVQVTYVCTYVVCTYTHICFCNKILENFQKSSMARKKHTWKRCDRLQVISMLVQNCTYFFFIKKIILSQSFFQQFFLVLRYFFRELLIEFSVSNKHLIISKILNRWIFILIKLRARTFKALVFCNNNNLFDTKCCYSMTQADIFHN